MDIEKFVKENIEEINKSISNFKESRKREYNDVEIKKYLRTKIFDELYVNPNNTEKIIEEFSNIGFKKNKIDYLANKYVYYKNDLLKLIETYTFSLFNNEVLKNEEKILSTVINDIFSLVDMNNFQKNYIKNDFEKIMRKSLFISTKNGFPTNIINIESGVMTANAGDSAQFLFLSRAILAGYNASNVDVRSSRYDTIIDFKGRLLKIQVKGISSDIVSFKDRDRGGQGIDYRHERNRGKRITSKDCDIYVAVDKQIGICYLIPMYVIDTWPDEKIVSVKTSELIEYRENWQIIDKMALR